MKAETWRKDYNEERPHSSLKNATPQEFAEANGAGKAFKNLSSKLEYV